MLPKHLYNRYTTARFTLDQSNISWFYFIHHDPEPVERVIKLYLLLLLFLRFCPLNSKTPLVDLLAILHPDVSTKYKFESLELAFLVSMDAYCPRDDFDLRFHDYILQCLPRNTFYFN